jgi:RimJ/RimL family protein N-acetyltransferase
MPRARSGEVAGSGVAPGAPRAQGAASWSATLAPVQTARLELRPIAEEDLEALAALDALPEIRAAIDPFGEHVPEDPAALLAYERRLLGHPGFLAAVERRSGAVVGWFQFEETAARPTERELGYRLRPETWGKGYATEGAAALLRDAFSRPDVTRVYAHALLDNPGSIRVMEKIGMTYVGPWSYRGLPGAEYEALAAPRGVPAALAASRLTAEGAGPSHVVSEALAPSRLAPEELGPSRVPRPERGP